MDKKYYQQLVKRYLDGTATDDELEVFAHLMKEGKLDTYLISALNHESDIDEADNRLLKTASRFSPWLKYAAAILLFAGIATALFKTSPSTKQKQVVKVAAIKNDALPGGNNAVLTLANGKKLVLGNFAQGTIAQQGGTQVNKINDGQLAYQPAGEALYGEEAAYNTINTPKGGEYQVILPDGSKVWLNSVSSITFPTAFTGNERRVTVTGEVYFEVAKNKAKPFIVEAPGQTVQVLGTHFNINAYADESAVMTTLLEGSIKIAIDQKFKILTPGQQAHVSGQHITVVDNCDTETAVAWKNGNFVFNNTSLPALMRQLSRWYDINIVYSDRIGDHEFVGQIKRNVKLSSVLKILAASGLHFTVSGKNLYIQP